MKKIGLFAFAFLFAVFVLGAIGTVSATSTDTVVSGTIYQNNISNTVSGANVQVICLHSGVNYTLTTVSGTSGEYSVAYPGYHCVLGDSVTVNANKDSMVGTNDGSITMTQQLACLTLDVGVINVPLVPEFGFIGGSIAILGSLITLFFVRKK